MYGHAVRADLPESQFRNTKGQKTMRRNHVGAPLVFHLMGMAEPESVTEGPDGTDFHTARPE